MQQSYRRSVGQGRRRAEEPACISLRTPVTRSSHSQPAPHTRQAIARRFAPQQGSYSNGREQFIAGKITQKLRPANLLALSEDAAAEIQRRIWKIQAPRLKRGMDTVFHLYLNETCRDVLETFLRREGIPVPTRHKARAGAAPAQPQIVPRRHLVSLDAPVDDDEDMTLGDTVSVADEQLPETLVLDRLERLDVMRTLPPEHG